MSMRPQGVTLPRPLRRHPRVTAFQQRLRHVPTEQGLPQIFPEAIDLCEPCCPERRQLLVEVRGEGMGWSVCARLVRLLEHGCDVFAGGPFALASHRGYPAIMLLQRQRRGVDQVKIQKDAARLQVRADIAVDLADALEIAQIMQTAGGHGGIKGAKVLRQPVFVEEVGLVGLKARAITGHDLPGPLQHRLGTVLGNAGGVGELIEDELTHWPITGADIQERDCGVCRKWEQVA